MKPTLITITTTTGVRLINPEFVAMVDPNPAKLGDKTCFKLWLDGEDAPIHVVDPWSVVKKCFDVIALYPNPVEK